VSRNGRRRGASQVEYIILIATAFIALAGFRVFGAALKSKVQKLATCVPAFDCAPATPSNLDSRDGPITGAASTEQERPAATTGVQASTETTTPNAPATRMPGDGLPSSTARLVNRLWVDPQVPSAAGGRISAISDRLQGYDRRWSFVHNLYDDAFSRKDAANAEHFYLAADFASMLPIVAPVVGVALAIGWDGILQPIARMGLAVIGKVPARIAAREISNDWHQVYVDMLGIWWGTSKRSDPFPEWGR
jgi:hypothetical protein